MRKDPKNNIFVVSEICGNINLGNLYFFSHNVSNIISPYYIALINGPKHTRIGGMVEADADMTVVIYAFADPVTGGDDAKKIGKGAQRNPILFNIKHGVTPGASKGLEVIHLKGSLTKSVAVAGLSSSSEGFFTLSPGTTTLIEINGLTNQSIHYQFNAWETEFTK